MDVPLWTLKKDCNEAQAVLRWIDDLGWEVRLLFRGRLSQSRIFYNDGLDATEWAEEWRRDLGQRGWREKSRS